MNLLIDENISYRIISKIRSKFTFCIHVERTGIEIPSKDRLIWDYALSNDCVILTFDEDFENLSNLKGFPPKVILLRTGNSNTEYIAKTLLEKFDDIDYWFKANEFGVLEIYR